MPPRGDARLEDWLLSAAAVGPALAAAGEVGIGATVLRAVRLARPGGLGRVEEQDVATAPTLSLREVMALAAERDAIAREYTTDFAVTWKTALPPLRAARRAGGSWSDAAVASYLATRAAVPDTLIARKRGAGAAALFVAFLDPDFCAHE